MIAPRQRTPRPGPGEGLTLNHVFGQVKLAVNNANLVLVQQLNGLAQLELQIFGQAANVVVGLNAVLRLQDVWIDGVLSQEANLVANLASFFFEHADKLGADDLTLGFGLVHVNQLVQEAVGGVNVNKVGVHLVLENVDDLLAFALAHKAVVHMHADKLLVDLSYF